MTQEKTKMYLGYLRAPEREAMTNYLSFLHGRDNGSKEKMIGICASLYSKEKTLERLMDNGNAASGSYAKGYYVIIDFEGDSMSEQAISELGRCDEWDWRYFYGIAVHKESRELFVISYSNAYSPNWNNEYKLHKVIPLKDVGFPLLKDGKLISRMDWALHGAINDDIYSKAVIFSQTDGAALIIVKDQHGNYCEIKGKTLDDVFRDYADNYTGYSNYRRQMASEWAIVSNFAREMYEEWLKTAKGLKSDFDKFYGGGIVD